MRSIFLVLLCLFAANFAVAQTLTGIVVDGNGAAIENAFVTLLDGNLPKEKTQTDTEGRFTIAGTITTRSRLTVNANGFAPFERLIRNDGLWDFTIVLRPATVGADVTVSITRTETRLSETPASVLALTRQTLDSTAAQAVDDTLRQVAGYVP